MSAVDCSQAGAYAELCEKLPPKAREYVARALRRGHQLETVLKMIDTYLSMDWIRNDPSFSSDAERIIFAARVAVGKLLSQPPEREYLVVPVGLAPDIIPRNGGTVLTRIYALVSMDGGLTWHRKVILARHPYHTIYIPMKLFTAYRVKLSDRGNILEATANTSFLDDNIVDTVKVDPVDFLEKAGVSMIKLQEVWDYVVHSRPPDWSFQGIYVILNRRICKTQIHDVPGVGQVERKVCGLEVVDPDVPDDTVLPDGRVVPAVIMAWTPWTLCRYEPDSEIFIYGFFRARENVPSLNAIGLLPIHAREGSPCE